ncbi:hypothetical protein BAUCODRAFT_28571 [Baudoinia panamericana UAMH 10762]|uniref:Uncharacterized protein n=1 Tax=Baudoinia panamericana (strain UAMH 10762) TaxID=717646 RepID=M2LC20_BAUPA|nr:uncharacterized protein BAUCODRAFT_28571 [Baudoinia panamericana UAMH 10762]EMC91472.1 hypothetical protein BAUCODRAFT_28571 [Baudoinia panamericana UAMH 10762]
MQARSRLLHHSEHGIVSHGSPMNRPSFQSHPLVSSRILERGHAVIDGLSSDVTQLLSRFDALRSLSSVYRVADLLNASEAFTSDLRRIVLTVLQLGLPPSFSSTATWPTEPSASASGPSEANRPSKAACPSLAAPQHGCKIVRGQQHVQPMAGPQPGTVVTATQQMGLTPAGPQRYLPTMLLRGKSQVQTVSVSVLVVNIYIGPSAPCGMAQLHAIVQQVVGKLTGYSIPARVFKAVFTSARLYTAAGPVHAGSPATQHTGYPPQVLPQQAGPCLQAKWWSAASRPARSSVDKLSKADMRGMLKRLLPFCQSVRDGVRSDCTARTARKQKQKHKEKQKQHAEAAFGLGDLHILQYDLDGIWSRFINDRDSEEYTNSSSAYCDIFELVHSIVETVQSESSYVTKIYALLALTHIGEDMIEGHSPCEWKCGSTLEATDKDEKQRLIVDAWEGRLEGLCDVSADVAWIWHADGF